MAGMQKEVSPALFISVIVVLVALLIGVYFVLGGRAKKLEYPPGAGPGGPGAASRGGQPTPGPR